MERFKAMALSAARSGAIAIRSNAIPCKTIARVFFVAILTGWAASWIGYDFGLLVGASASPIAATAAPLVFGLLAAIGIGAAVKTDWTSGVAFASAAVVSFSVWMFCESFYDGTAFGLRSQASPYIPVRQVLPAYETLHSDVLAAVYGIRHSAHASGLSAEEYQYLMSDVIRPVLVDCRNASLSPSDTVAALNRAMQLVEQVNMPSAP